MPDTDKFPQPACDKGSIKSETFASKKKETFLEVVLFGGWGLNKS